MSWAADEVVLLARNLARNCGYAVFPCGADKRPMVKGWPERASTEAEAIELLWCNHSGPLIGIATGKRSGVDVLDLDVKHHEARGWYHQHRDRIAPTRCFRTRSGGVHFMFVHAPGVRNSAGKIAPGVDVRGDGGYAISWFSAGFGCIDHSPPAAWPTWLLPLILPPPAKPVQRPRHVAPRNADAAIVGILQTVSSAAEGQRNQVLNWASYRLGARVVAGELGRREAEALLSEAAAAAGLAQAEARATITSGLMGAGT